MTNGTPPGSPTPYTDTRTTLDLDEADVVDEIRVVRRTGKPGRLVLDIDADGVTIRSCTAPRRTRRRQGAAVRSGA